MPVAIVAAVLVLGAASFTINRGIRASALQSDMPAATASAPRVMKTYLDAAKRQDCDLTAALTTATGDPAWCGSRGPMAGWLGEDPQLRSYTNLSAPQRYVSGKTCFTADIDQTGVMGASPGELPFEFCLMQTQHGWRVVSEEVDAG